jgi:hypothetical protein
VFGRRDGRTVPVEHAEPPLVVNEQVVAADVGVAQHERTRQPADSLLHTVQPRELGEDLGAARQHQVAQRPQARARRRPDLRDCC